MPCSSCRGAQGTARGGRGNEDGDRQEEEEEVEGGEASQRECAVLMTMDECESAQDLSHECM